MEYYLNDLVANIPIHAGEFIKDQAIALHITEEELAKRSNLPLEVIHELFLFNYYMSYEEADAICKVLRLPLEHILKFQEDYFQLCKNSADKK